MAGSASKKLVVAVTVLGAVAGIGAGALWQRDEAEASPYEFLLIDPNTKGPVRYNPCSPIHYVINPDGAPNGGVEDVKAAISTVADATGIEFVFDGLVDERLGSSRRIYQPEMYGQRKWAPLLIGWVPEDELVRKGRHAAGAGGSAYETNGEGSWVFVSGLVTLNADILLTIRFDGKPEVYPQI